MRFRDILMAAATQGGGAWAPTFVASDISTIDTIAVPGSAAVGDLAIISDFAVSPAVSVTPSGFSLIGTVLGSTNRRIVSYKVLVGGEGTLTGMAGATSNQKAILIFRKPASATWGTPGNITEESTTNAPADQTVAAGTSPSIVVAVYCGSTGAAVRGFTPAQDAEVAVTGGRLNVRYKVNGPSGAAVVVTMNDDGSNILTSFRVSVA